MKKDAPSLRQKIIVVLTQRGEPMSYRELTDAVWATYPEYLQHMLSLYETKRQARIEQRIRLEILVEDNPGVFTATKSEGIVLVGLVATEADVDNVDEDAAADESMANPGSSVQAEPPAALPTVLVVEDDESISHLLVFMLERAGFNVHLSQDGRQAQQYIEQNDPPTLVLLDVSLPYVDGFTLLRTMRDRIAWDLTPIIMLTAKAEKWDVEKALRAGANDYLRKPFNPAELLVRVNKLHVRKTPITQ